MVEEVMIGDICLVLFVMYIMGFDKINEVFDLMYDGKLICIVIYFED